MDKETKRYINDLAEKVIEVYAINVPIDSMEDIVRNMRGRIEERNSLELLYDGTIRKLDDDKYDFEIAISESQSSERKNFTIAHELGHLFLHMGYRTNNRVWEKQDDRVYMRFGSSEQEYQANEFAAALLMPEYEFERKFYEFSEGNRVNITKLANYFKVSRAAALTRGRFLGYIE